MIVDPRRRPARPVRVGNNPAPLVVVIALALEAAPLVALSGWEPVGVLLEEIADATRGEGGLTHREVARVRTWAANYDSLATALREFYAENCADEYVSSALWYVLGTTAHHRPPGVVVGNVHRLWEQVYGARPEFDLFPQPTTQEPRR